MKSKRRWLWPAAAVLGLLLAAAVALSWAPDRSLAQLSARWAPPPSQFIALQGMQVHVRDEGPRDDAQPVVLIHGTSASLHTWEGWVVALKGTRRVIRMDLPAFGLTGPASDNDYSIERYVAFVLAAMDRLGVRQAVLGGNSLGGEIAWNVALSAPSRVTRLILVDAAGYPLRPQSVPLGFRLARMPWVNRIMANLLPRALIEASVRNVFGDPGRVTPALVDRYYELTLREGNRAALPLKTDSRCYRRRFSPSGEPRRAGNGKLRGH
jgi:pimeloyl-ACP methyl ester carboxylesterase